MNIKEKTSYRKILVRNTEHTLPEVQVKQSDTHIKSIKKPQKPAIHSKKIHNNNKIESKFDHPQSHSSEHIAQKMKAVERMTKKRVKSTSDIDKNQHLIVEEKVTKQVNFPYEQPIYKDLIPLCVKMQSQPMITSRKPLPLKDKEPNLNDFFTPRKIPEYMFNVSSQINNIGQMRQYRGLKLYRTMESWSEDM